MGVSAFPHLDLVESSATKAILIILPPDTSPKSEKERIGILTDISPTIVMHVHFALVFRPKNAAALTLLS